MAGTVIRYLLLNSSGLKKCTELAISENLEVPRSTIMKVLSDLSEEPVLESQGFSTVKPYMIKSIGLAVDRGYVSFASKIPGSIRTGP